MSTGGVVGGLGAGIPPFLQLMQKLKVIQQISVLTRYFIIGWLNTNRNCRQFLPEKIPCLGRISVWIGNLQPKQNPYPAWAHSFG
ncbi:hypothetical protein DBR11_08105 [Pedobacter sp. HMWF019]|nr:hypothetical protein DBR11_08105 [Pedobacter sp. HMWF019]